MDAQDGTTLTDPPEHTAVEDDDADVLDPAGDEEEQAPQAKTLLDRLRVRRAELAEEEASGERTLTLAIPGFNDQLFARFTYRPDAWDRLKKIGDRAVKSNHSHKELHAALDTLAYACTDILVSEDGGDTYEPIDRDKEGTRFDAHLADLMGFEAENARQVVRRVFNNDLAVTAMSVRVSEWMQGEDEAVDEDFGGS